MNKTEKAIVAVICKHPKIKLREIQLKLLKDGLKISLRNLRYHIYDIRCKSTTHFIVAGDMGFKYVSKRSKEFQAWKRRYEKYVDTHMKLLTAIQGVGSTKPIVKFMSQQKGIVESSDNIYFSHNPGGGKAN